MTCPEIQDLLRRWRDAHDSLPTDIHAHTILEARAHAESCPSCRPFASILALMEREVAGTPLVKAESAPTSPLPARVLRSIAGQQPFAPRPILSSVTVRMALAAVLVAAIGVGLLLASRSVASPFRGRDTLVITFELVAPEASTVHLVGDFTDWDTSRLVLTDKNGDGLWVARVRLRASKTYAYNFLIDGERWIADPGAATTVDDGFGGDSSILVL